MADIHDTSYYIKCMGGGILSCGLTHTAIVTLDLIKCRRQIDPKVYKGLGDGIAQIRALEGLKGLTVGWAPTFVGYSCQGFGKFGFYEIFKDVYKNVVGEENAAKYQTAGFLISSACAEVIADTFLCPFEAIKVRVQTDMTGEFPRSFSGGWNHIMKKEGWGGFYKGIIPLWCRQVPYTMVKFAVFERTVRYVYGNLLSKPKSEYSKATQLGVTFLSGYYAGIFCAIISHPADTMVSKLNKETRSGSTGEKVSRIYKEIGFKGLWNGLGIRILMVGTLTGLQWWIYDSFKSAAGLATSGGK